MAGLSGCLRVQNQHCSGMATGPPDAVVDQEPVEENPGKKKSKFQAFKSFFVKKKRKESGSGAGDTSLKSSQSSDHVSGPDTTLVHADKDSQSGSKINLALKALSHDSVFVSDSPSSQDIVHDKVKSLQLQLKQSITHGSRLPRTDDDTGTLSEDDGLPCSPMEFPVLGGSAHQMCEAVYPEIPVDFSQPASASACLDSSMARHRINIKNKACTKRRPATREKWSRDGENTQTEVEREEEGEKVRLEEKGDESAEDLIQIPDQDSRPEFPAQPQIAEGQATSLSSYSSDGEEYVQQAKILPSRLSDSCEASTLLTIPAGNVLLEQSSKTCLEETGSLLQEVLSSLTSGLVLRPEGVLLEMEVDNGEVDRVVDETDEDQAESQREDDMSESETCRCSTPLHHPEKEPVCCHQTHTGLEKEEQLTYDLRTDQMEEDEKEDERTNAEMEENGRFMEEDNGERKVEGEPGEDEDEDFLFTFVSHVPDIQESVDQEIQPKCVEQLKKEQESSIRMGEEMFGVEMEMQEPNDVETKDTDDCIDQQSLPYFSNLHVTEEPTSWQKSSTVSIQQLDDLRGSEEDITQFKVFTIHQEHSTPPQVHFGPEENISQFDLINLHKENLEHLEVAVVRSEDLPDSDEELIQPDVLNTPRLLTEPEEDIIQSKTENRATDRQDFASLACAESTTVVLHSDSIPTIQEPEEQETGQIRFTIASAWQRTANGGSTKEPSSSENVSVSPPKHTVEKAETLTPVRPECLFSPVRTLSTPILLPPTGRSSASEEPNPENLFGIRLRKTPVRFRQGSDTDVRPDDLQHGPASESDITRSGLVKPDRNLGQAPHPSPESAGWISLARRKQKVFKENSLEEPLLGKSLTEDNVRRTHSLPLFTSQVSKDQTRPLDSPVKVTCSVAVVQPQDEPPWLALAKKKAKAWSEMAQIVQ
ncbi:probable serine/threonine-protein kinase kinX isoform X2 [Denticeps clupeoides]|uniref:probable serine/threonine-protein kinase kinX isoform X2 n=1 Tax=Denticeps clupeoides TaxID=299321 RepID=UPI0010A2D5D9|nr:probable serine/threonine-protein kinase kinX isoform X2 [Denticeps clupeoides]